MKIHSIFALAMLIAATLCATDVNVAWDPNPETDNVVKYTVHWGDTPGVYTGKIDVAPAETVGVDGKPMVKATLDLAPGATYYIAVTAMNAAGLESLPSKELEHTLLRPAQVALPVVIRLNADGTWEIILQ